MWRLYLSYKGTLDLSNKFTDFVGLLDIKVQMKKSLNIKDSDILTLKQIVIYFVKVMNFITQIFMIYLKKIQSLILAN